MRRSLLAAAVLTVAILAFVGAPYVLFNEWYYPRRGLEGLGRDQTEAVFRRVGDGFAGSEGLRAGDLLDHGVESYERGRKAYAWGVMEVFDASGKRGLIWMSLSWWDRRGQWMRLGLTTVIGDPRDSMLYPRSLVDMGNGERLMLYFRSVAREVRRRFREMESLAPAG